MKKILSIILALLMLLSLTACGGAGDQSGTPAGDDNAAPAADEPNTNNSGSDTAAEGTDWVIYWYLCGSDLETNGGAATNDLLELLEVQLPENVKVLIQTGGAAFWQNDLISAESLERYLYDNESLKLVDTQPLASMGSKDTLSSFLAFGKAHYPAAKTGFIFWNHGGGSVSGAAFDEIYGYDSLTLDEMYAAFSEIYELSEENQPFELIGFDTCLMATVDTAYTFSDIGKYLVASQELEPGNGWLYSGWLGALAQNPEMSGAELGRAICDSYMDGCIAVGIADNATLSLTNLSKVGQLVTAYDNFGKEALAYACADPSFFSAFARIAVATANYGGNTKEQGFTNMADLGDLAYKTSDTLTETAGAVLSALNDCVEYTVSGQYRAEATGLSCYYSYNGDIDDLNGYINVGVGEAFKYFYSYGLTGTLDDEGMEYIQTMDYTSLQPIVTLKDMGWDNQPLDVDSEGAATMTLGPDAANVLSGIYIQLFYIDPENDLMLQLGIDNDLHADWENGIFKDNFRGVWGAINGELAYMELGYEGDGYNQYIVPILLNGESYNMMVIYDFEIGAYEIQGARKAVDENGMTDKNLRYFVDGDVITTIHYASIISSDDGSLIPFEAAEITVDGELSFTEEILGDGIFLQVFEMRDIQGNTAYSDVIMFEVVDGTITTTVGFTD